MQTCARVSFSRGYHSTIYLAHHHQHLLHSFSYDIISYTVRPITYTDTVRPMCNLNRARLLLQCSMKNLFKPTYDDNGKDFDSSSHSMPYPPRHHRQSVCCEMHFPKTNTTTSPHFNSSKALFCHSELLASIDLEI